MKRALISPLLVAASLLFLTSQSTAQVTLYDNTLVDPPFQFADIIGVAFTEGSEKIAQQFKTAGSPLQLSEVSIQLQRLGSPTGSVNVELWEGVDAPTSHLGTIGSFDLTSLSDSPEFVTFDGLTNDLASDTSYFVLLNNDDAVISGLANTYRFGLLGQIDDEQSDGTNGAIRVMGANPDWLPLRDLQACDPSGACPNYLRMSVTAVPEPVSSLLLLSGIVMLAGLNRRNSRA